MNGDILEKVLAYIDAHIYEKINLSDLSEIAAYSPFYFSKLFSEAMGMPVTGYIRIRKLQHALVSLLEGLNIVIFGDMALSQEILCDWIKEKSADIGNLIIKVHCVE